MDQSSSSVLEMMGDEITLPYSPGPISIENDLQRIAGPWSPDLVWMRFAGAELEAVSFSVPNIDSDGRPAFGPAFECDTIHVVDGSILGYFSDNTFGCHIHAKWRDAEGGPRGGHLWQARVVCPPADARVHVCWGPRFEKTMVGGLSIWAPSNVPLSRGTLEPGQVAIRRFARGTTLRAVAGWLSTAETEALLGSLWVGRPSGRVELVEVVACEPSSDIDGSAVLSCVGASGEVTDIDSLSTEGEVAVLLDVIARASN